MIPYSYAAIIISVMHVSIGDKYSHYSGMNHHSENVLRLRTSFTTTWSKKQFLFVAGQIIKNKIYTKNKMQFSYYFCNLYINFAI